MGAVRMKQHCENITIIHTTPAHHLTSYKESEKVVSSESGEKYRSSAVYKSKTALNKNVINLSLEEVLLWIIDAYFGQKCWLKDRTVKL